MKIKSMNEVLLNTGIPKREDAIGILLLLHLADKAMRTYFNDSNCEMILSSCASQIKSIYAVSESEYAANVSWKELSFGALLRILEYVRVEICTTFDNKAVGEQLAVCIAQLAASRQFPQGETLTLSAAPRH